MSLKPPRQLTTVGAKVEARLDLLFCEQRDYWRSVDPRLAEAVDELAGIAGGGGKRLRAAFCYWAWRGNSPAAGEADQVAIDVGAAFELLQTFALVHDDVMDDSATRRGRPTVHTAQAERLVDEGWLGEPRRFGEGVAILVGDLSHAYADALMADAGPAARRIWDELRIELNLGQYLDLRAAAAGQLDQQTAEQVSTFKSALYTIVRPLQLGASIDGPASPALLEQLERYGRPLGRAFQLKDDLLGVLGDEAAIGKPVGDDLREGKPTELAALATDRADASQRKTLSKIGRRDLDADDVAEIVDVFIATGAVEGISERVSQLVTEATAVVDDLPFDRSAQGAMAALAGYVAARNS
ncbi:MAG: polyprenyl synthetase family protein [Acidimicrobiales bacterium]